MSESRQWRVDAGASPMPQDSSVDVALNVIGRLRDTLRAETEQLRRLSLSNLRDFSLRKSQCLLELTRIAPCVRVGGEHEPFFRELTRLNGDLAENRRLLRLHLDAASEVTEIISRVIQDDMSDGTYSSRHVRD